MTKYATFTSFRSGEHNIALQDHLEEVTGIISITMSEGECELLGITMTEVIELVSYLEPGDNTWIEFDDSTWMTIQRMS